MLRLISFPKMYTFTDITLTHKKLWHKTFVKKGQICEGCGSVKDYLYKLHVSAGHWFNQVPYLKYPACLYLFQVIFHFKLSAKLAMNFSLQLILLIFFVNNYSLKSQIVPRNPGAHVQVKEPCTSLQVAPFRHGLLRHSFTPVGQRSKFERSIYEHDAFWNCFNITQAA